MGISSFPVSVGLETNKPYLAEYFVNGSINTYYTALNVTSGQGKLHKVSFGVAGVGSSAFFIKITVDGTAYEINPTNNNPMSGFTRYNVYTSEEVIDNFFDIVFKSSLKVEIKQSNGTKQMFCAINYSLK